MATETPDLKTIFGKALELRRLAAQKLAHELAWQTLDYGINSRVGPAPRR